MNWNQVSTSVGHWMPLLGIMSRLRSTGLKLVLLLATRCLYLGVHLSLGQLDPSKYCCWPFDASTGGYVWVQVNWTQDSSAHGH